MTSLHILSVAKLSGGRRKPFLSRSHLTWRACVRQLGVRLPSLIWSRCTISLVWNSCSCSRTLLSTKSIVKRSSWKLFSALPKARPQRSLCTSAVCENTAARQTFNYFESPRRLIQSCTNSRVASEPWQRRCYRAHTHTHTLTVAKHTCRRERRASQANAGCFQLFVLCFAACNLDPEL